LLLVAAFVIANTSSAGRISGSARRGFVPKSTARPTAPGSRRDIHQSKIAVRGDLTSARFSSEGIAVSCNGRDDTAALIAAITSAGGQWVVINNGQTCAGSDLTIPHLRIEKGGLLKPLRSHTITLSDSFEAGNYQVFTSALPGEGTIKFSGAYSPVSMNPLWWATNATPGTTDMTGAIQAAINATGGRGKVHIPQSSYLISTSLTIPAAVATFSPIILEGEGPFLSNLINKAPANNPTLVINHDLIEVRNLGFWGSNTFPNDGIRVSTAGRIYIEGNEFFTNGNAIFLERAQSLFIENNFGSVSGGATLPPVGVTTGWSYGPTTSFIYVDIPAGGFVNHLVVRDNMNEGYVYKLYTNQSGDGVGFSWLIDGNQFEGGTNNIYMKRVFDFSIRGNYLSEGTVGYAMELEDCRGGQIDSNYIHFTSYTAKESTVKLTNVQFTQVSGTFATVWLAGTSNGLVFNGGQVGRLIDETSDRLYGMFNVGSGLQFPDFTYNIKAGSSEWRSESTSIITYPGARPGDTIRKKTPAASASPGWICTTAGSTGALVQIAGSGPDPVVLPDYYYPTAYDFRITITTGGSVGTAVYTVEYKPAGGGTYASLATNVRTAEVPRVIDEVLGALFTIKWPAGNYVAGNKWTLTAVTAPVWTAIQ
jgi:hypothetical protein